MNPHKKETRFLHDLDERLYTGHRRHDADMWVEAGGLALIICTITCSTTNHANVGFRLVDENNNPLPPYRSSRGTRNINHFTAEPFTTSPENLSPITFHMIVSCKYVKLQILPDDSFGTSGGAIRKNSAIGKYLQSSAPDRPWSHKPISTMTAIPLLPHYQGGANTVFTYPSRTRMPRIPEGDKTPKSSGPT